MKIQAIAATDRGQRRENNEDHYLIDEPLGLYVVCDGMGGHAAGEVAAQLSVTYAAEHLRKNLAVLERAAEAPGGYFRVLQLAEDATQEASRRVYVQACSDANSAGMGSTMTMLLVVDNKGILAHVGDSRLYLLRDGALHQLTSDHTLANELRQAGTLTAEQAANSPYSHVLTRTIGQQEMVQVESLLFDLFPEDTCLLCSDGLSNYLEDDNELTEILQRNNLSAATQSLVELANLRGGADNITLIVLRASADGDTSHVLDLQHRLDTLKSTFLCHGFSASRLMRVLNITALIECVAGQKLFSAGQTCDGLYVVLDGRLAVEDNQVLSSELSSGDCLGELSLVGSANFSASVIAEEPSRILLIHRSQFAKLTRRLPKLGNALLRNLCLRLSERLNSVQASDGIDPDDTGIWEQRPSDT